MKLLICAAMILTLLLPLAAVASAGEVSWTSGRDAETGIRYITFGSGEKTMVIVPGLSIGYVTDSAQAVVDGFSQFAKDFTVYLFDIREDVPEGYDLAHMGEDLTKAIINLGLKDIYLYGCSMGGMQSIYIAGTHPELVKKAVVASSACRANDTSNAVIGSWIASAKAGDCHALTADMGQKIYSRAFYEANAGAFDAMADALDEETLTRFVHTASAIPDMDLTEQAKAIRCPVLAMGSEGDEVLTAQGAKEIAGLTGGELYLYGGEYSHAVYDEEPGLRVRALDFFLGE